MDKIAVGGVDMELCGEVVRHKVFGSGQITEFSNNYITVLFDEGKAEKKFIYPSAFGAFLELENTSFQDQIEVDKNEIARKLSESKRFAEELARVAIPIKSASVGSKRKKSVVAKSSD
jgi:hypothetical protein